MSNGQAAQKRVWTYHLAMAASRDAANRRMQAEGRTSWNIEDWNEAVAVFERLFPLATKARGEA